MIYNKEGLTARLSASSAKLIINTSTGLPETLEDGTNIYFDKQALEYINREAPIFAHLTRFRKIGRAVNYLTVLASKNQNGPELESENEEVIISLQDGLRGSVELDIAAHLITSNSNSLPGSSHAYGLFGREFIIDEPLAVFFVNKVWGGRDWLENYADGFPVIIPAEFAMLDTPRMNGVLGPVEKRIKVGRSEPFSPYNTGGLITPQQAEVWIGTLEMPDIQNDGRYLNMPGESAFTSFTEVTSGLCDDSYSNTVLTESEEYCTYWNEGGQPLIFEKTEVRGHNSSATLSQLAANMPYIGPGKSYVVYRSNITNSLFVLFRDSNGSYFLPSYQQVRSANFDYIDDVFHNISIIERAFTSEDFIWILDHNEGPILTLKPEVADAIGYPYYKEDGMKTFFDVSSLKEAQFEKLGKDKGNIVIMACINDRSQFPRPDAASFGGGGGETVEQY